MYIISNEDLRVLFSFLISFIERHYIKVRIS